jgi:hypothetical protein
VESDLQGVVFIFLIKAKAIEQKEIGIALLAVAVE